MIIGTPPDSVVKQSAEWTISGAGAAFLSNANFCARPAVQTSMRWLSGAQTTSSVLRLRVDLGATISPGLVYIAGTSLPAGTKVQVAFHRPADTAGTYPYSPAASNNPQRIIADARGAKTCAIVIDEGADACDAVEVAIYNDVNGVASIVADSTFTIGAILPCSAYLVCATTGTELSTIDPTATAASLSRSIYAANGMPYRQLTGGLKIAGQDQWIDTYSDIIAHIDRGQYAVYIPRIGNALGEFDAKIVHADAIIGVATKLPSKKHVALGWYSASGLVVDEVPVQA